MKQKLKIINVVIAIYLLFGFVFLNMVRAAEPQFVIRFAAGQPMQSPPGRSMEYFAKLIAERTKGQVKFELFYGGSLFSDKDMPNAIPKGALDMGALAVSFWSGLIPPVLIFECPFIFNSVEHQTRFENSAGGEILKKEFEKIGVKYIHRAATMPIEYFLTVKKPILKLEDFKGLKIRVQGGEMGLKAFASMGASPLYMSTGEVYMALQRGIIDAANANPSQIFDRKFYEPTKYITRIPGCGFLMGMVVMNLKKFNSLPNDYQKILLDAGLETQNWLDQEIDKADADALEYVKKIGKELYDFPPAELEKMKNIMRPITLQYLQERTGEIGKKLIEEAEKVK